MADPRTPGVFADLLSTALVGTDRRPARTGGVPGPLGAALSAVPTADPAGALLDAAALATVYRRAGTLPVTGVSRPRPAPAETRPEAPPMAGRRLGALLDGETVELVVEWLELAAMHGVRVPHWLLPRLLDRARHDSAVRVPMLAAGGTRIRWLAAQNRDWGYLSRVTADGGPAGEIDDADWDFGGAGRRLDHLRALRAADPAAARGKLAADWSKEAPAQRAALLGTFTVGLSVADEEFLEAALDDRRKEVREVARSVLVRLPESGYARRMAARARACLTLKGRKLVVSLPGPPDEAARRDGLSASARSGTDIGVQLLEQILDATPLAGFRALGGSLSELLSAAKGDDKARLAGAITLAARRESDADSARALGAVRELLRHGHHKWFDELYDSLLTILPDDERDRIVADRIGRRAIGDERTYQLVAACPRPWSVKLGGATLAALRKHASRLGYHVHRWAVLLGERLPVELLPEAEKLADTHDNSPYVMGRLGELAALRQQMHKEFL